MSSEPAIFVSITGSALAADTNYHIAVTRAAGLTRLWKDGVQQGSTLTDATDYGVTSGYPRIGGQPAIGGNIVFLRGNSQGTPDGSAYGIALDTTGADFLVLAVSDYTGGSGITLSDLKGNSWTPLTAVVDTAVTRTQLFYSKPTSVGSDHSVTINGTSIYSSTAIAAFSGVHAIPFDVEATGAGTGTTASAGSGITPSQNSELIVAGVGLAAGSVSSISSSFSIVATVDQAGGLHQGISLAYKIQTALAAVDPDWTLSTSGTWGAVIASFKAA
jgi:hypothetical protein